MRVTGVLVVAGVLAVVVIGAGVLIAAEAPKPKVIEAEKLILRDSKGNRADLAVV